MTTFEWNCKTVDVHPTEGEYTDVVYNIHWIVTGTSDQVDPEGNAYTSTSIGTQMLDTSTITDFIPFADLTNAEVVQWTTDTMGTEQVDKLEAGIESSISEEINPTSITITIRS